MPSRTGPHNMILETAPQFPESAELILLLAAIVIEIPWLAWTAGIVGALGAVSGLSRVAIGNLIRDWD